MNKKREGEPKTKQVHFRIPESAYRKLVRVAKAKHRDTVPALLYAEALELADTTESRG